MPSLNHQAILVTGGAGFIGAHLVAELRRRGAARVVVLDKAGPTARLIEQVSAADLTGFDCVFHLAAMKHHESLTDPAGLIRTNIAGTQALLAAAAHDGVGKVVLASSLYAYGRITGPPMREEERVQGRTLYGISKVAGEMLVEQFATRHGLPGVSLRFFFAYGPGQATHHGYRSVITANFARLRDGRPPRICGDGEQRLDYVHVDDVVRALCRAMESPVNTGVFNVGSGHGISINELTALMQEVAGTNRTPVHEAADETAGSHRVADIRAIEAALGWRPTVPLREGLAQTWRALVERR